VQVTLAPGGGKDARVLEVRDNGIGIAPIKMKSTILSLNESNKLEQFYLAGAYGQGGSSTLAFCKYAIVASREITSNVGFTVVKYDPLNPEKYKIGHYVYFTNEGENVLEVALSQDDFPTGTVVRHIGFDLSSYISPLGPNSVYGGLNTNLFDPAMPIWLNNDVHGWRRVIKGSRNALNGAVDEGDPGKGPELSHKMPMFHVSLGDFGSIGIEYWVLAAAEKSGTKPSAAFVNPSKPIVLTLNGQNHGEFTQTTLRKTAQLPFLSQRLICHIDCNSLSGAAKRQMFVSNREGGRDVQIRELILKELLRALQSDDELRRLNDEARRQGTEDKDENALQQMRGEVAKLLLMQGMEITGVQSNGLGSGNQGTNPRVNHPTRRPIPEPIPIQEPPSFVRFVWDAERPITFYPGERRYLRLETDANKTYYSKDPDKSRINLILHHGLLSKGSTELVGGRMRVLVEASEHAVITSTGEIKVEIMRSGLAALSDKRKTEIVPKPKPTSSGKTLTLPQFEVVAVDGPEDPKWDSLGWSEDISKTASEAEMQEGVLTIYYSSVFPKFASTFEKLHSQSEAVGQSFVRRYKVWLAAHSLLLHRDQISAEDKDSYPSAGLDQTEPSTEFERSKRRRLATLAALMAAREVKNELATEVEE
jgi:hypothetical protein